MKASLRWPNCSDWLARVAAARPATSGIIVATGSRSLIAKSVGACATTPWARQTNGPSTAGTEAYVPMPTPATHAGTSCSQRL